MSQIMATFVYLEAKRGPTDIQRSWSNVKDKTSFRYNQGWT